ncbi:tyrosine-type recombinase/integrase [Vibrio gazogenes]|uniref:Integrase/recombinase XerD n=1 Tax=Vibrio gazogenes DSM 21264 = NBRC 103151 TaxID=1123492 RepID=A0A1M5DPV2_VIBGA|nr:tyrosine-type recombinase/integrase [Vibrio gazogenes]USP14827.1 tyrosine-type recombinase/integrase [Vibrio gazogenes]SHF69000.1 integrase/recombinase XerD [Vibrio gazogenes DSM 21264] [Vibrio gazogenes DSM 21264 = NBRC 103151]SJN55242.1 Tyrosine recombinase XerD [Vibrio gazogenes]
MKNLGKTVAAYLLFCEKCRGLSKHTIKAYHCDLQQFIHYMGIHTFLQDIGKQQLTEYHEHLITRQLVPTSIKRKLACIKAMFKWLEQEESIEINPFHKFRFELKIPKRLPRNVPRSDLRQMLTSARANICQPIKQSSSATKIPQITSKRALNQLTKLLSVELLIATGIRVSELASLKITDIFVHEGKLKILGKGSRERYVYLPDQELRDLVMLYMCERTVTAPTADNFLVNSRGQPASTQFLRKLIRELSIDAHTQIKVTPHMLRHSAACELLESGLDIRFVQRLLGHSNIATTEIYTHVSDTALQEKLQQARIRSRIMIK